MENLKEKSIDQQKQSNWLSSCKKNIVSQFGEDGIIEKIFETIKDSDKWCVEFGAWDGKLNSNTWNLIKNKDWSAVLIEADNKKYEELLQTYKDVSKAICVNAFVNFEGLNRLDNLLLKTPIPKCFDLLSIDIDGNDYFIWESIEAYAPKVIVIEFNPSISTDTEFIQPKNMEVNQGSSLLSLTNLGKEKGYELVATTLTNAFFVKKKYFELFGINDNSPDSIHRDRKYETRLFQLYDGTLILSGNKKLLWHEIEINQKEIQILPRFLRRFPDKVNPISLKIFKYVWRGVFVDNSILTKSFKNLIKKTFIYRPICYFSNIISRGREMSAWNKGDKSGIPPFAIKQKIIRENSIRFSLDTLIETGTYLGHTVAANKNNFKEIFSVELDKKLYERAKKKFNGYSHIHIIFGNSPEFLLEKIPCLKKSCLFWLDAHYSGGITAKGSLETPIMEELKIIMNHSGQRHVILIDDAHSFTGKNDYPDIGWLKNYILKFYKGYVFEVENNIIKIYPDKNNV